METDLDAVLIDAFDAEPAAVDATPPVDVYRRQSDVAMRGSSHAPVETSAPAVALRHYPSLDALGSSTTWNAPPPRAVIAREDTAPVHRASAPLESTVRYPRWLPSSSDALVTSPVQPPSRIDQESHDSNGIGGLPPPQQRDPQHPNDAFDHGDDSYDRNSETPVKDEGREPKTRLSPPRRMEPPTDEEIAQQQRLLQAEIKRFQAQADYMALALAGQTPHQIEARRQREEERKEREERRLAAMETRVLNVIEREQQREARQLERRLRHAERTHRSSVSPSPEREDTDHEDEPPQGPPTMENEP